MEKDDLEQPLLSVTRNTPEEVAKVREKLRAKGFPESVESEILHALGIHANSRRPRSNRHSTWTENRVEH